MGHQEEEGSGSDDAMRKVRNRGDAGWREDKWGVLCPSIHSLGGQLCG